MKKRYIIEIEAKPKHQPTHSQIFGAVKDLVDERKREMPDKDSSSSISLNPDFSDPREES